MPVHVRITVVISRLLPLKGPAVKGRLPSKIQCLLSAGHTGNRRRPFRYQWYRCSHSGFYHIPLSSPEGANRSVFLFASLRPDAPRSRDAVPLLARFASSAKHRHSVVPRAFFIIQLYDAIHRRAYACVRAARLRCVTSHSVDHPAEDVTARSFKGVACNMKKSP